MPQIEVTFDIDANGILHVSAKDRATGKEQSIRIEASSGLHEADIQRMVQDAEAHAGEDRKRKETVEARNRADALVYEVEKNLREHGDKIESSLKSRIESAVSRVRDALKGEDSAAISSAAEALEKAWQEAAAAMYQAASGEGAGAASGQEGAAAAPDKGRKGDGAVDADYEVVN